MELPVLHRRWLVKSGLVMCQFILFKLFKYQQVPLVQTLKSHFKKKKLPFKVTYMSLKYNYICVFILGFYLNLEFQLSTYSFNPVISV